MTASLETLVVAAYVFASSLSIPRPGPAGKITDQELVALAVAQAITGLSSDRQFLGQVDQFGAVTQVVRAEPVAGLQSRCEAVGNALGRFDQPVA